MVADYVPPQSTARTADRSQLAIPQRYRRSSQTLQPSAERQLRLFETVRLARPCQLKLPH
jgi:hypothetical protein